MPDVWIGGTLVNIPYGTSVVNGVVTADSTQFPVSSGASAVVAQAANAAYNEAQSNPAISYTAETEKNILEAVKGATAASYAQYLNAAAQSAAITGIPSISLGYAQQAAKTMVESVLALSGGMVQTAYGEALGTSPTYITTPQGIVMLPAASSPRAQAYQNIALFGTGTPGVLTATNAGIPVSASNVAAANLFAGISEDTTQRLYMPGAVGKTGELDPYAMAVNALPTREAQEAYIARNDDPFARISYYSRFPTTTLTATEVVTGAMNSGVGIPGGLSTLGTPETSELAAKYLKTGEYTTPWGAYAAALESQRLIAAKTGDIRLGQFFATEETRAEQFGIQMSAEMHFLSGKGWTPYAGNPWEASADTYLELMKGYPNERISPLSYTTPLPTLEGKSVGLQEVQWAQAIQTDKGVPVTSFEGSYMPALQLAEARTGQIYEGIGIQSPLGAFQTVEGAQYRAGMAYAEQGALRIEPTALSAAGATTIIVPFEGMIAPSSDITTKGELTEVSAPDFKIAASTYDITERGNTVLTLETPATTGTIFDQIWNFFQPGKEVTTSKSISNLPEVTTKTGTTQTSIEGGILYTDYYTTTGGTQVTENVIERTTSSGFDTWLASANKQVSDALGLSALPKTTAEDVKGVSPYLIGFGITAPVGMALQTPVLQDYVASYFAGEAQAMKEQPVTMGVSTGIGIITAGALKGLSIVGEASRVSFAEKAISEGSIWRAAETFVPAATKAIPTILGAMYGVSVAERTTAGGTDLSPAAAERFGGIVATEVRPMTFGTITPSAVYEAARMSDIGYKSALQEGTTQGRLQYYVTEPATKPLELAKIDYAAYVQEAAAAGGNPTIPSYLVERAGFNIVPATEPVTIKYESLGVPSGELASAAYGKSTTIADILGIGKSAPVEPTTLKYTPSEIPTGWQAEAAYGKQPTLFEAISESGERAFGLTEIRAKTFVQEAPGKAASLVQSVRAAPITVKSYLQETQPFENLMINLKYPAAEISRYNLLQGRFAEAYGGKGAAIRQPITPLSKTFGFQIESPKARAPTGPSKPFSEVRGSSGQVSVIETPTSIVEPMSQVAETGWRGVPEFPALIPSPVSRQKYRIEEETQYLRLPPGMERPSAQKTQQIQYITPMQEMQQRSTEREVTAERTFESGRFTQTPIEITQFDQLRVTPESISRIEPSSRQTTETRQTTTTKPITVITPVQTPWTTEITTPGERTTYTNRSATTLIGRGGGVGSGGGTYDSGASRRFGLFAERFNVGQGVATGAFLGDSRLRDAEKRGIRFGRR
jgi:hypothetical protein